MGPIETQNNEKTETKENKRKKTSKLKRGKTLKQQPKNRQQLATCKAPNFWNVRRRAEEIRSRTEKGCRNAVKGAARSGLYIVLGGGGENEDAEGRVRKKKGPDQGRCQNNMLGPNPTLFRTDTHKFGGHTRERGTGGGDGTSIMFEKKQFPFRLKLSVGSRTKVWEGEAPQEKNPEFPADSVSQKDKQQKKEGGRKRSDDQRPGKWHR